MLKTNITTKKYRNKLLTHIYGQVIALIVIIGVLIYMEITSGGGVKIIYFLLSVVLLFLFFGIKRIFLLFEKYENESALFQDSFEVLENVSLYIVDLDFNYLYMNKSNSKYMYELYKIRPKIGENVAKYIGKDHMEIFKDNIKAAVSAGFYTSKDILKFEGNDLYMYTTYSPVRNSKGEIYAVCCVTTNITDSVQEKEKFTELIYQDPLTNVFNRRKIFDYYQTIRNENKKIWFLVFDLDNFKTLFKTLNDRYGHATGDQLLIDFSNILKAAFPASAIIARLGGDEFSAIVPELTQQAIVEIEAAITKSVCELNHHGVSVSIGKTLAAETQTYELAYYLDIADKKMYEQKKFQKQALS